MRDPEDEAADRRIEAQYWSLPHAVREAVDTRIGWHLLLGGGCSSEAQLVDALRLEAQVDDALRQAGAAGGKS